MLTTQMAVIKRIEELCDQYHHNVNSLARISAVPPSTIKSIIYGASDNPGIVTIKMICDGLDISLIDFFNSPLFENLEPEIK